MSVLRKVRFRVNGRPVEVAAPPMKRLLDVLRQNEEVLEAQAVYQDLAARIVWAAEGVRFEQTPQYAPIRFAGHEAGEFFFKGQAIPRWTSIIRNMWPD